MGVFSKFRETAASIGVWNAILFATSKLASALAGNRVRIVKYYFTVQPIVAPDRARTARSATFDFAWVGADCALFSQIERPPSVIAARFAQGARCLVAAHKGQLAGFLWFVIGPYEEDEVRARFVPGPAGRAAWDFDVMIMPQYRLGRLFSYLWNGATAELAASGVQHTISRISAFNAASIASHRRLGARIVGQAVFVCVGELQLMRASVAPHWHVSRRLDQRPVLLIQAE